MILSLGLNHAIFSRNTKWNQAFTRNMQGANFLILIPQPWIYLTRPKTDEQSSKWNWFHTKESLKKFQVQNRTRPFHPPTVSSFRTNFQNVISDDLEIAFISVLKLWRFIYCLNGLQYLGQHYNHLHLKGIHTE